MEKHLRKALKANMMIFFIKLSNSKLFPTTSQPSAGDFYEVFKEVIIEYDEVIAILLSSKLSGTYNSAVLAKEMLGGDERITIIDSETSASNLRFLIEDAVEMAKENKSAKEIEEFINNKKKNMYVFFLQRELWNI